MHIIYGIVLKQGDFMDKKRIIFDLDCTLLTCNYSQVENEMFNKCFGEDANKILNNIGTLLDEYELLHSTYNEKALCKFLNERTKLNFNDELIKSWVHQVNGSADTMEKDVIEVLDYLKSKNKSLVVLTNWFGPSQIARLKEAKIYDYFDEVFTGEYQLKPHKEAYLMAMGEYDPRECLMIGDSVLKDYQAPMQYGIDSILYDKNDIHNKEFKKVKRLNEIIRR